MKNSQKTPAGLRALAQKSRDRAAAASGEEKASHNRVADTLDQMAKEAEEKK